MVGSGNCASCGEPDLQSPDDSLGVVGVEPGGSFRVRPGQLVQKSLPALSGVPLLQFPAKGAFPVEGSKGPSGQQRINIQSRSPGQDGQVSPGEYLLDTAAGHVHISGDREVFRWAGHVQHVVGDALHFRLCGLGRADVHAAVDLHGVCRHHFAAVPLCQLHRKPGFA